MYFVVPKDIITFNKIQIQVRQSPRKAAENKKKADDSEPRVQGKTSEINVLMLNVYISSIIQRRKNTVSSVEGPMMMMMRKAAGMDGMRLLLAMVSQWMPWPR